MKVKLPSSWSSIKIDQFPLIHDIIKDSDIDPIDKEIRVISILSGLHVATIEQIALDDLKNLIKKVGFIFQMEFPKAATEFNYSGYTWKVCYDITKLSAGEFISLTKMTESEDTIMRNIAEITAIFIKPYTKRMFRLVEANLTYEEKLDILKTISIGKIYPVCVFFCKVLAALSPVIEDYLSRQSQQILTKIQKEIQLN